MPVRTPYDIDQCIRRGRQDRDKDQATRRLCRYFWDDKQYWYLNPQGQLRFQTSGTTGVVGSAKPGHRVRNTHNYIQSIVEAKVSAATGTVPGYEVTPATDDPEDESAASFASQVAIYGYDQWYIRHRTVKIVTEALVAGEAFARPYFDRDVGPYSRDPQTGEVRGTGEVRIQTLTRDEVMWEKGTDFLDSPWYAVEKQWRRDEIEKLPGYTGGLDSEQERFTLTEYLERPCLKYPLGRRMFLAAGRPVCDYRRTREGQGLEYWWEPYPLIDAKGRVWDEPPFQRLSYTVNPDEEEGDRGLVHRLIDPQRTINDCLNKAVELKNRALHLQMLAPKGANMAPRDDSPGAVNTYTGPTAPQWEPGPDPQILAQLLSIYNTSVDEIRTLAADVDIQAQPRLAEGTAQLAQSNAQARWASFLGDLAEFHSRLMRQCLTLVARYYTTPRQIEIRGQYGWQSVQSFTGKDLRSQVNVRVLPGSLATKSRQAIQAEIQFIQANWPGAISPEAALATMHGGSPEGLLRSYKNDVEKALRVVQRLMNGGPDALLKMGERWDPTIPDFSVFAPQPDPITGQMMSPPPQVNPLTQQPIQPPMGAMVPNWMPGPMDKVEVWRTVVGDAMKTIKFEQLDMGTQHYFWLIWQALDWLEQQRAAAQAAMQQQQAQSLGMSNAAAPQLPPPLPDRAGFNPGDNQSPVPSPAAPPA